VGGADGVDAGFCLYAERFFHAVNLLEDPANEMDSTSSQTIRDAKVTAEIKGLGSVVARTDATGVYKLPGFAMRSRFFS
jgi:hypothetical protein